MTTLEKIFEASNKVDVSLISAIGGIPEALDAIAFLDKTAFDEKVELDFASNSFRNIHHVTNKYYVPVMTGDLDTLLSFSADVMVHPDDSARMREFFDPDTLPERLAQAETPGIANIEVRQRLVNGRFRWVSYLVVYGERHGLEPGKLIFYVYDVQNQVDRQLGLDSQYHPVDSLDPLTGLPQGGQFFDQVTERLAQTDDAWDLMVIDIDHFRYYNEWYGRKNGDFLLGAIGSQLQHYEDTADALVGYLGNDDFCLFIPRQADLIDDIMQSLAKTIESQGKLTGFFPTAGVTKATPGDTGITLYDKALTALQQAKLDGHSRVSRYDSAVMTSQRREMEILGRFQQAVENDQFTFYLQPQCNMETGAVVGAEALCRWIDPRKDVIGPSEFIPILEKTGFITDLDRIIWEKVCAWIGKRLQENRTVVPISVNVSEVDVQAMDVAEHMEALAAKHGVDPHFLKVEITESANAKEPGRINKLISDLHMKGFSVLMDDFGSGYSSLNMLDGCDVDIVKLDSEFMNTQKGGRDRQSKIVDSIVNMTKRLGIPIVVEGIEDQRQVTFLSDLGCRYAQGFYFFRPMTIEDFEQLLDTDPRISAEGIVAKSNEQFRVREFLDESLFTDAMLNNVLGPVGFYTLDDQGLQIDRFNEQFYREIGDVKMEDRKSGIQDYVLPEDRGRLFDMLKRAREDKENGAKCEVRFEKSFGGAFWYRMHIYFLGEDESGAHFYGKILNISGVRKREALFMDMMKSQSQYCLRVNLTRGLVQYIGPNDSFANLDLPFVSLQESVRSTAEKYVPQGAERDKFLAFYSPARLAERHQSGIFEEVLIVPFILEGKLEIARFSTYYTTDDITNEKTVCIFMRPA